MSQPLDGAQPISQKLRQMDFESRRSNFDNRDFWNQRYADDPLKGSGPGSRGNILKLKSVLVKKIVETYGIKTILDVGCGDIAMLPSLEFEGYVGVDISDVVIGRNRLLRPELEFVCADLSGSYSPRPAELTLCLDVLIHQKDRGSYLAVLSKALSAAQKVALISGYSEPDPGWNVFFHEPISASIGRLSPNSRMMTVAQYRGTDLVVVEK